MWRQTVLMAILKLGLKAWDCAAGDLIVREAGGLVCDFDAGNGYLRSGNIIAAPARVLKEMLNKIRSCFR